MKHNQPPVGVSMGPRQPQVNYQQVAPNQPPVGVPMGPRQPQVNYQQANPNQPGRPIPPLQAPQVHYVVVQGHPHPQPQPPYGPAPVVQPQLGQWSTGLCDCFEDAPNCCITLWCPCITFGQIAEIVDRGGSSCGVSGGLYSLILLFTGCCSLYSFMYRTKLKLQYGMPHDQFEDCCIHFWCEWCALCQEYRELQHRGFEVALGWHGNAASMNVQMGATTPPIVQGGMMR